MDGAPVAHDEYVRHDSLASEAIAQRSNCPLESVRPRGVLHECRPGPGQCVGPLNFQFCRETWIAAQEEVTAEFH
jgi:hypothetical protein